MSRNSKTQKKSSQKSKTRTADIIIVGAGIAGLYLALRLKQANKNRSTRKLSTVTSIRSSAGGGPRVVVLESSNRVGGRVHTVCHSVNDDTTASGPSSSSTVQYEAGAARFSREHHQRVWRLLQECGLDDKVVPITGDIVTHGISPDDQIDVLDVIQHLDVRGIARDRPVTLLDIIREQRGQRIAELVERNYYYYAELGQLAWWDAYKLFTNEFQPGTQYYALGGKGGLSQLPMALYRRCKAAGVRVYLDSPVTSRSGRELQLVDGRRWRARQHIIYACPADAVSRFDSNLGKQMMDVVQPTSLYRIYAGAYPKDPRTGHVWFHDMDKMSVPVPARTPLKFVIPISTDNRGNDVIMISYTDSKYAEAMYSALDAGTNDARLLDMVKQAFAHVDSDETNILKPAWVAHHYWSSGAGFWRPGVNSTQAISRLVGPHVIPISGDTMDANSQPSLAPTSAAPTVSIWITGENLSHNQGWMEGALESAELVLSKLRTNRNKQHGKGHTRKSTKRTRVITKAELAKHNTRSDAWLAINGQVYNVTDWINQHPGGDIILKGLGRDATAMFNGIRGGSGHPNFVNKKLLPRYLIGRLSK